MKITKEECERALEILKKQHDYLFFNLQANYPYTIEKIKEVQSCFKKLVNEHFDNPPLKFEEIHEGMWIFDTNWGEYFEISDVSPKTKEFDILIHQNTINVKRYETIKFEENRFFIRQVKDDAKRTD